MGQKVNPVSNRLGIIRGWDSNWFGGKDFSDKLVEDARIRKYLNVRLQKASISKIIIERTLKLVTVTIATARPGIIIGKGGAMLKKIGSKAREDMERFFGCKINLRLWVKVKEDWRQRPQILTKLGFNEHDFDQYQ